MSSRGSAWLLKPASYQSQRRQVLNAEHLHQQCTCRGSSSDGLLIQASGRCSVSLCCSTLNSSRRTLVYIHDSYRIHTSQSTGLFQCSFVIFFFTSLCLVSLFHKHKPVLAPCRSKQRSLLWSFAISVAIQLVLLLTLLSSISSLISCLFLVYPKCFDTRNRL